MYNLCTLSDYNYLLKGLVLYESLLENNEDFVLHYLCLDRKSYVLLSEIDSDKIIPYYITDLIIKDDKLRESKESLKYREFCWSLASYFSLYLMKEEKVENIIYIDSDIVFYLPVNDIYKEVGDKSIGIIRHRNVPNGHRVGEYNVGIIYFKNDKKGIDCCDFWWSSVIDKRNKYYSQYGTCGDQKYLELFPELYGDDLCIIDKDVGHGAPFNFDLYDYKDFDMEDKVIYYEERKQNMIFCHFMKFIPYFDKDSYRVTDEPFNQPFMKIDEVKGLYDDYYKRSCDVNKKYFEEK